MTNNINDEDNGIRPWVARRIESISLGNNDDSSQNITFSLFLNSPLNEPEMVAVTEALCQSSQVEKGDLQHSLRGSPAVATATFLKAILETHPSIKEIDLGSNNINNILAEVIGLSLKTNTSLMVLDLGWNEIGPDGAEALADGLCCNKTLQLLLLSGNKLGDMGVTALAETLLINKTLEKLNLGYNRVTVNGAKALASALEKASIKELDLHSINIQDEGGKAFAESLNKNTSLTRLDLWNTDIGDKTDKTCKALAASLRNNSSLRELVLAQNRRITNGGLMALEETLKHLNHTVEDIELDFNEGLDQNQLDRINRLCAQNRRLNAFFQLVNQNIPTIPLGMWPKVLENVECKPDLLFALLKTNPELSQSRQPHNRCRASCLDCLCCWLA